MIGAIKNRIERKVKIAVKFLLQPKINSKDNPLFLIPSLKYKSRWIELLEKLGILEECLQKKLVYIADNIHLIAKEQKFILPIVAPLIEQLNNPEILNDPLIKKLIKNRSMYLLFDLSQEAITFNEFTSDMFRSFHNLLKQHDIPANKVYFITSNYNAQRYYSKWAQENSPNYKIQVLGYNFYVYEYLSEIMHSPWFENYKGRLLASARETVYSNKRRSKYFLCLNLRPRWHRKAVMLHLFERGFLDKGYVSYFGEGFGSKDTPSVDTSQKSKENIATLHSGKRLLTCLDALESQTPITFERTAEEIRKDLWERSFGAVNFLIPESKNPTSDKIIDTYFEIVTETWFTQEENLYITEKTTRPILRLQPFIHVGSPFVLEMLRKMGFKTFSPYINEDYDRVSDPHQRIEMLFEEIDRLCNMPLEELHDMYCKLWPVLEHNFKHFCSDLKSVCYQEVKDNILCNLNIITHK